MGSALHPKKGLAQGLKKLTEKINTLSTEFSKKNYLKTAKEALEQVKKETKLTGDKIKKIDADLKNGSDDTVKQLETKLDVAKKMLTALKGKSAEALEKKAQV